MQSITNINVKVVDGEAVVELTVPLIELKANWTVSSIKAREEGLPEMADRLLADVAVFDRLKSGDTIVIVGGE